jgi:membrane-bound metal-dependent hydrolase YbcI (DUF457 family)
MNFKGHAIAGVVTAGVWELGDTLVKNEQFDWASLGLSGLGGLLGSMLPDILEPAYHPNHRSLAHSWSAAGTMVWFAISVIQSETASARQKAFWRSFLLGALSHLALDACTPKSLPLVA